MDNMLLDHLKSVCEITYIELKSGFKFETVDAAVNYCLENNISPTPLFDIECYLKSNEDILAAGISPIVHYFEYGYKEGRRFNYSIDGDYYRKAHGLGVDVDVIQHYKANQSSGASLSPLFDEYYYRKSYELQFDTPFEDYLMSDNRNPSVYVMESYCRKRLNISKPALMYCGEFNRYHDLSPTVKRVDVSRIDEYHHPHVETTPLFDTEWYKSQNPDVEVLGAYRHYALFGEGEGRPPCYNLSSMIMNMTLALPGEYISRLDYLSSALISPTVNKFDIPQVSAVILNWNKSLMTIQCVLTALINAKEPSSIEIIVVDNGSSDKDFAQLFLINKIANVKIVRNKTNRFYGEANNIGVEEATGEYILLLNNDAFLNENWDQLLLTPLLKKTASASGPKFIFPDGRLQEAGGQINACGQNVQIGKGLSAASNAFNTKRFVNHVSAACFMLSKKDFLSIGGFDSRYEPAYYEDADLTAKLAHFEKKIQYIPDCVVVHIENATSKDPNIGFDFGSLISTNRTKFVERWSNELMGIDDAIIPYYDYFNTLPVSSQTRESKVAVVYSPYNLTPGGGERYILSVAKVFAELGYNTYFASPERYSKVRILNVGHELGIDCNRITPIGEDDLHSLKVDISFIMSNELAPSRKAFGSYNIYHCQFPFPMSDWHITNCISNISDYDLVVVNSNFTKHHYEHQAQQLGVNIPNVYVLNPPVKISPYTQSVSSQNQTVISNVGRFIKGGHCKNQLKLIEAFNVLINTDKTRRYKMYLVGSLSSSPEDREYYAQVVSYIESNNLNVELCINASSEKVDAVLDSTDFYWHATGLDKNVNNEPWVFEHFGITPIEAMSFGAIPIVAYHGGPAEVIANIVKENAGDFLCSVGTEYATKTLNILAEYDMQALREKFLSSISLYSEESFSTKLSSIVKDTSI